MGDLEWKRTFVFLLKFNTTKVSEIAVKLDDDRKAWGPQECVLLPVAGDYDMVAMATRAPWRTPSSMGPTSPHTKRYTVCSMLTGFEEDEFRYASGVDTVDPHKKG